jgi:hypothetical protein
MTKDEILSMILPIVPESDRWAVNRGDSLWLTYEELERFSVLVSEKQRNACAYQAGIALLGADKALANRVDQAIRARGNK